LLVALKPIKDMISYKEIQKAFIEKFMEDKELEKQERKDARKHNNIDALKRKIDQLIRKQESIYRRRRVGLKYPEDENVLADIKSAIK
jgi:hypothetical protein